MLQPGFFGLDGRHTTLLTWHINRDSYRCVYENRCTKITPESLGRKTQAGHPATEMRVFKILYQLKITEQCDRPVAPQNGSLIATM